MEALLIAIQQRLIDLGCRYADLWNNNHKRQAEQYPYENPAGFIHFLEIKPENITTKTASIRIYIQYRTIAATDITTYPTDATYSLELIQFMDQIIAGLDEWKPNLKASPLKLSSVKQDTDHNDFQLWSFDFEITFKTC